MKKFLLISLLMAPGIVFGETISGTVVDESGNPVKGVYVQDVFQSRIGSNSMARKGEPTKTDKQGKFSLESDLTSNAICVDDTSMIASDKRVCVPINTTTIQFPSSKTTNISKADKTTNSAPAVASTTKSTKTISGTVVDKSGAPVPGVVVMPAQTSPNSKNSAQTQDDGTFTISNFPESEQMCAESMGYERTCVSSASATKITLKEDSTVLDAATIKADVDCNNTDTLNRLHATKAQKTENKTCVPTKCKENYTLSDDKTTCEQTDGNCSQTQINAIPNATSGKIIKGKCKATECKDGFEVKSGKCVAIEGKCTPDDPNAKSGRREVKDGKEICVVDSCKKNYEVQDGQCVLSNEHSAEDLEEKSKKVNELREKEQSLANRMISGVSIGAAGIGGMMLAQSLSEQNADKDAEQDMAAYLATFRCEYAGGKSVPGGTNGVQLPADKLFDLYQEYVTLASDVKEAKSQLGLKPGIESEVILDKANIGLYDDTATGKTNGTYASVARALTDTNSADAQKWNDQKTQTDKNMKIGIGVGVGGAAVGLVGNILTNHVNWDKIKDGTNNSTENTDKIKTFKDKLKTTGMTNVDKLDLSKLDLSEFDIESMDFDSIKDILKGKDATKLFKTSNAAELRKSFESLGQEQ